MSFYTVDFGPELAGLPNVGLTQLQADGTVVVARTPAGVVALGLGVYGVALVPDAACAVLRWDSGADVPVYAHEGVEQPNYIPIGNAVRQELQAELTRIVEIATLHGLVIGSDLVVTPTSRTAGSITQTISGDGIASSTVSRTI